ncbi:MAG: winged helix-turn-helix domain-containing protein, partial [Pyrinomonadaceae bacterium]
MSDIESQIYEFGEFRIDVAKRLLTKGNDVPLPLTPKVFDTLLYLVRHSGKVIEKDELMREIWTDAIVEENNLTQNISILRRIFSEKPGEQRFIVTSAGHGYRFVPEVVQLARPKSETHGLTSPDISNSAFHISNSLIEDQSPSLKNQKPNRKLFAVFASVVLIGIIGTAFYFWRGVNAPASTSSIKTIAILPFKPLSAENRNESLELGMADTLINNLSASGEIVVRPISSVRRFNNLDQDSAVAGRELGVDSVLEGNIQNANERIRVSTRLIRTSDGRQLWSGQFDEKFTDIFAVQDSISQRVAEALTLKLSGDEQKRLTKRYTENVEAYQHYLLGRFYALKLTGPELQKGISYLRQAIAADPAYAIAYVGLADAYRSLSLSAEVLPAEVFPQARAAAVKAIEIDDTLAEAHSSLGNIIMRYDWDRSAAENQYRLALDRDPNSADTHVNYAHLLSSAERHTDAIAEIKRARELDPLNLRTRSLEAQFLSQAGQPDEALDRLQNTFELDPNFWLAHQFAASAYIDKGMYPEAMIEAQKAGKLTDTSHPAAFIAYALAKFGKQADARVVLDELLKLSTRRYVPAYGIALIYNGLDERDKTLTWLERAFKERDARMIFLKVEPKWNNLHSEPR